MGLYRPARQARTAWNVAKTLTLLLTFWFLFLLVLPIGISIVEVELGIQRFPPQPALAVAGLVVFSALAAWAALALAIAGAGTPAPFDTARDLVVTGPYAFVRHPLVIAAGGQGVAIGLALGSVPVLAFVVLSIAFWYFVVRRPEERNLEQRFGDAWRRYARAVRGFRPRLSPYRQDER